MSSAPFLMYAALRNVFTEIEARFRFDLVDTHYFYPDGVAAVLLGRRLRRPVVITARVARTWICCPSTGFRGGWFAGPQRGRPAWRGIEALRDRLIELGCRAAACGFSATAWIWSCSRRRTDRRRAPGAEPGRRRPGRAFGRMADSTQGHDLAIRAVAAMK